MKKYPYFGLKAYIELRENGVKIIFTEKDIKRLVLIRPNDGSSISFGEENGNK